MPSTTVAPETQHFLQLWRGFILVFRLLHSALYGVLLLLMSMVSPLPAVLVIYASLVTAGLLLFGLSAYGVAKRGMIQLLLIADTANLVQFVVNLGPKVAVTAPVVASFIVLSLTMMFFQLANIWNRIEPDGALGLPPPVPVRLGCLRVGIGVTIEIVRALLYIATSVLFAAAALLFAIWRVVLPVACAGLGFFMAFYYGVPGRRSFQLGPFLLGSLYGALFYFLLVRPGSRGLVKKLAIGDDRSRHSLLDVATFMRGRLLAYGLHCLRRPRRAFDDMTIVRGLIDANRRYTLFLYGSGSDLAAYKPWIEEISKSQPVIALFGTSLGADWPILAPTAPYFAWGAMARLLIDRAASIVVAGHETDGLRRELTWIRELNAEARALDAIGRIPPSCRT